ncbi:hypothetical protein [Burkholderia stagnalis]|uniref:hypothetical protein n=1 Tax=Burkholderia stagnalis TaxID=1503054 RepID=UPI0021AB8FBD|nr:hypothetical protein [Burkholderia stagnalis]
MSAAAARSAVPLACVTCAVHHKTVPVIREQVPDVAKQRIGAAALAKQLRLDLAE